MNEKEVYINSILTFAFTNDGKIIFRKDKEGKYDTLPWLFFGYSERDSKVDYEDSIWVMKNIDDYKEKIAIFFAYYLRNTRNAILNKYLIGNGERLLDVGELHEKISKYQIEEMKTIHNPSYIRIKRGVYDGGINWNGQKIINRIETRYVILPSDDNIEKFPELEAKSFDELGEVDMLSDKVLLGITGENGKIMESFVSKLESLNENISPKM